MARTITALKAQTKNRQRLNIYLDGEYAFSLSRIVAAWLQVGQSLDEEKIAKLLADDQVESTYQRALRLISIRPRTEKELEQYFTKWSVPPSVQMLIVERLRSNGWINDQQFAEQWVDNRLAFRPTSKKALRFELQQKGVQLNLIAAAIQDCNEEEMAFQAAQKIMPRLNNVSRQIFRQKVYSYLARRGFPYDVISEVMERIWNELQTQRNITTGNEELIEW